MNLRRLACLIACFLLGALSAANLHAAAANVVLSVTQSGSPFGGGHTNTYQISVSNKSTAGSGYFTVQADIPINTSVTQAQAGAAYCSSNTWPCAPGEELYWNNLYLYAGQSATLQFAAQLKTPAPADGSTLATTVTTSLSTTAIKAQSTVRSAGGLQAGISCPPTAMAAAGTMTCVISYGNSGTSTIKANLSYTFPSGLTVLSHTPGGQVGSGVITWNALTVTAGGTGYELATLQAPKGLTAGNNLTLSVSLQSTTAGVIGATAGTEAFVAGTDPLQIGVSATPDPVQAGHTVTYSIHVSNTSASSSGYFTLYASVPNYMRVTEAQAAGAICNSGTWPCEPGEELTWHNEILYTGQGATLQFSAVVSANSPPPKGSVLTSTITTGLGGSATSQVLVAAAGPELALTAPEQVPASGQYTYTLTYGNAGSSTEDTELVMAVPAGTTFVSASPGAVESGGIVTWKATELAPGQSASHQLVVQAPKRVGTIVTGSAEVINATTRLSYSRATADTVIASTNPLQIGVSAAPDPVQAGRTVTYSVHVSDTSAFGSGYFTLYASVPNYMSVTQAQAGGGYCASAKWPCEPGEELNWIQYLYAGQSATRQFSALISSSAPPPKGSVLTSTITTELGGSATSQVLVAAAGPELALTAPEQVPASGQYTYTLTYGNAGSSTEDTELVMAVPAGTTFVSASSGAVESGGIVTWKATELAPGQSASQQLVVQAPKGAGTIVTGSAEVIDATTRLSYSRATADTVIASSNPLQIGVSAAPDPVQAGHTVTYSVHLSNTAASGSGDFALYASVPHYMSVTQAQAGGADCSSNNWPCEPGEELYWNDQYLFAGQSATRQFSALINSSAPPPKGSVLTSTITTDLGGSATSQVLVAAAGPELALTAPEQLPASGQYTYTLTYGNAGSSTEDTELVMAVPAGTTFVSASPGAVESGGIVTWKATELAPGLSASQQLVVQAPKGVGTIVTGSAEVIDATTRLSYSRATADTVIASTNPLQIGVSTAPDPVQAGHTVTYSVHVSNPAASGAGYFTLYASVPNYMSVTQAQADGAYCSSAKWPCAPGEELYWNYQYLYAGQSETRQFSALVNSGSPPPKGSVLISTITTGLGGSAVSVVTVGTK